MAMQALNYAATSSRSVKIQTFRDALDLNDDGAVDGRINYLTEKSWRLAYNLPAGSGFTMGFVGGLRSG
jgi:hypothetical protein